MGPIWGGCVPAHCHVMNFTVMRTLSHSRRRAKYSASHPAKSVSGRVQFIYHILVFDSSKSVLSTYF